MRCSYWCFRLAACVVSITITPPLAAQNAALGTPADPVSPALAKAATTITRADVAQRIRVIAADSMLGRDTPSRGLEQTARYIADQFEKFGLTPAGDSGRWFQRYPIARSVPFMGPPLRRIDFARSRLVFKAAGQEAGASFATAARLAIDSLPESSDSSVSSRAVVVVSGRHRIQTLSPAALRDKVVLYVPLADQDSATRLQTMTMLYRLGRGLIILSDLDSAEHTRRLQRALLDSVVASDQDGRWAIHVRPEAVPGLLALFAAAGLDLAPTRADTTPTIRPLSGLSIQFELTSSVVTVPNVVGVLEGSDPTLKHEYLVFSAHMDHIGVVRGSVEADSINNGADDNASGTVGVLELAEAFSRPGARPKRSIIFLAVSGEEKSEQGSQYFVEHPPVPLAQLVTEINLDMIGRNWKDTVVAIGQEHSDLGAALSAVVAAHPELRMTPIADRWPAEKLFERSDHYHFAKRGVPSLFFFSGLHDDYHQVTDEPSKIDADKEARLLRLLFYLGSAVGNAAAKPQWKPESYRQIVQPKQP